jgi:hypothetical protein
MGHGFDWGRGSGTVSQLGDEAKEPDPASQLGPNANGSENPTFRPSANRTKEFAPYAPL